MTESTSNQEPDKKKRKVKDKPEEKKKEEKKEEKKPQDKKEEKPEEKKEEKKEKKKDGKESKKEEEEKKKGPSYFKRNKVLATYRYQKLTVREFDNISTVRGAAVLSGFPSSDGLTSMISANYIVDQLKLPLVGDIVSNNFPPLAVVRNGTAGRSTRIYGNEVICVIVSEYQLKDPVIQNNMVQALYDFAKRNQSTMLLTVDSVQQDPTKKKKMSDDIKLGISAPEEEEEMMILNEEEGEKELPQTKSDLFKYLKKETDKAYEEKVWYICNDEEIGESLRTAGREPVQEINLSGLTGGIVSECLTSDVNVVALFAPVAAVIQVGFNSAIALIHCIDFLLGKGVIISTEELEKTASDLDKKLKNVIDKLQHPSTPVNSGGMFL